MTDADRLGSTKDVEVATGIDYAGIDVASFKSRSGSVDCVAFGNAAEINPYAASQRHGIVRQQYDVFERRFPGERSRTVWSRQKTLLHKSATDGNIERACRKPAHHMRATKDFVSPVVDTQNLSG